jgi:hypothetical protein
MAETTTTKKYLDSTGVSKLVDLIKGKIQTGSSSLIQVAEAAGTNNNVSIAANSTLNAALSTLVTSLDKAHEDIKSATGDLSGNYYNKTEVDGLIAGAIDGVFDFQGTISSESNLPKSYKTGYAYLVSGLNENATVTIAGKKCENGDMIIAIQSSGESQTSVVDSHWHVVQNNWNVDLPTTLTGLSSTAEVVLATVGGKEIKAKLAPATSVTSGDAKVVTSGAVYSAIESAKSSLTGTGTSSYTTIKGVGDALETHKSAYNTKITALDNEDKAIRTAFAAADASLKDDLVGKDGYASLTAAKSAVVALSGTVSSNYNTLDAKINSVTASVTALTDTEVAAAFATKWP